MDLDYLVFGYEKRYCGDRIRLVSKILSYMDLST
jgi:hypothetical protein